MEDLALAKRTIILLVQRQSFPDELQDLEGNHKGVKKSSSIVKLKLMLCEHGILQVSGRISEAPSTLYSKHQILPQNKSCYNSDNSLLSPTTWTLRTRNVVISTLRRVLDYQGQSKDQTSNRQVHSM